MNGNKDISQLNRIRWAVRGALLLGVAASVAANILHAADNPISQTIAAWPPLALLITVDLISRVPVHRRVLVLVRVFAITIISGIAAWVSYWHMVGVALRYGETTSAAHLIPFSVDGLIVVASICLVELSGRIQALTMTQPSTPESAAADLADVPPWIEVPQDPHAPDRAPIPADLGTLVESEPAGHKVRRDARTAQEIEDAVRAIWAARPGMSQRKIAGLAGTSPSNAGRIIREAKAAEAAQPESAEGELVEAGAR